MICFGTNHFLVNDLKYKLDNKLDIKYYDFHNYDEPLFSSIEKTKIQTIYKEYSKQLDPLLLNPELAIYSDYQWMIHFYVEILSNEQKSSYKKRLLNILDEYKRKGIRNTECKSNILISIDLLNNSNENELIELILTNSKYKEYINYIFENKIMDNEMFYKIKKHMNKNFGRYKHACLDIYQRFESLYPNDMNIKLESIYIQFMVKKDPVVFLQIKDKQIHDELIQRILKNIKQDHSLIQLYIYLERFDELYEMLMNKKDDYHLLNYVHYFREKYSDELEKYFKYKFYKKLSGEMNREIYKKAAVYVKGISKLNDGTKRVNALIAELNEKGYKKRLALFDEIRKAIK